MTIERAMKTLNGSIVFQEDLVLSPGVKINVRIEDVSLMDVAAVIIAETDVPPTANDGNSPVPFSIGYDETKIRENMSYTIRAVIRDKNGKLLWITDTHTPVFTRGGPSDDVTVKVKRIAK